MTREDAIKIVNELKDTYIKCRGEEDIIEVLIDSVDIEALDMAIKALEQEPIPGADCIDRQTAITFVCKNTKEILKDTKPLVVKLSDDYLYENVAKIMRNTKVLSAVTPQEPRKGHWKYDRAIVRCSNCGRGYKDAFGRTSAITYNYCPNCGAKMVEPQEREGNI